MAHYLVLHFKHSIVIHNISEYDVKHIILSLKSAAAGWDNFPVHLTKQCINAYLTPLTYMLHQSMAESVFPDLLKTARVISNFMDKHNLLCKHQFGLRSKHSTQHAVISLVNNITNRF